jgi:DNA (cytosine-5)-methyltransferase 1
MKFADLFCGIGGFHQALTRLGHTCVFACDIDKNCQATYFKNYNIKPEGDITKLDYSKIPDFDILTSGNPCTSFSNAGKKLGLSDNRGKLFNDTIKIAKFKKPKFMFLENVKHIKNVDNGKVFAYYTTEINNAGYHLETFELSPHQLGVPQHRERIIFVCIRNDIYNKIPTVLDLIIKQVNIFEKDVSDKYHISLEHESVLEAWDTIIKQLDVGEKLSPTILCNEFYNEYTPEAFKALPAWKQDYIVKNKPLYEKYSTKWDDWYQDHSDLLTKREIYGKLEWQVGKKKKDDSIFDYFIQLRQSGIRVKKTDYFPTLVAIVQTPIYAKERRYITPRECARLQSFPDSFIIPENDKVAYKQFGNAVNVDVVWTIINSVLKNYTNL